MRLSRRSYRTVIVVHVASSVAWLGLSLSLLVLAWSVLNTDDPRVQFASGAAASTLASTLAIPVGTTALASGLVLTFGTRWSLRYRWVLVKLVGTALALVQTIVLLRPGLAATAAELDPGRLVEVDPNVIAGPIVSSGIYLTSIVLSYVKPWGAVGRPRRRSSARVPVRSSR